MLAFTGQAADVERISHYMILALIMTHMLTEILEQPMAPIDGSVESSLCQLQMVITAAYQLLCQLQTWLSQQHISYYASYRWLSQQHMSY